MTYRNSIDPYDGRKTSRYPKKIPRRRDNCIDKERASRVAVEMNWEMRQPHTQQDDVLVVLPLNSPSPRNAFRRQKVSAVSIRRLTKRAQHR